MFDSHTHTKFSGDSDAEPPLCIDKAKSIGLSGMTFTDHLDIDMVIEPDLFLLDLPAYTAYVSDLQTKTGDDFSLFMGIEIGMIPRLKDHLNDVLSSYPFDFCIGSVHSIEGYDPYFDDFFDGKDIKARLHEYMEVTLNNVETFDNFDSLGHLDYVTRYSDDYCYRNGLEIVKLEEDEIITQILKTLIKKDKSLEVNTANFRHGKKVPNPNYDILKKYYDLGGRMITIGSDAHYPDYIGLGFSEVAEVLKSIGFKSQVVYKKREPFDSPI